MKFQLKYLMLAVLFAGCSNDNAKSSGSPAPTDHISSKISKSGTGALTGQTALFEASHSMSQSKNRHSNINYNSNSDLIFNEMAFAALNEANSIQNTSEGKAIAHSKTDLLNKSLQNGSCLFDLPQQNAPAKDSSEGAVANFAPMKMKISGSNCPVELSMEMTMTGINGGNPCQKAQGVNHCQFTALLKMSYRVLDDKLANQLEVRSGSMNLNFEVDQTMPAEQSEQMNIGMKAKSNIALKAVDLQGQVYLVSGNQDADIKMAMGAPSQGQQSAPQMFGSMKEGLQYLQESTGNSSALSATITLNGNNADEKYSVDGVPVTMQVYESERDKFANSMMAFSAHQGDQDQEGNQQPNPPSDYPSRPSNPSNPYNPGHPSYPYNPGTPPNPIETSVPTPHNPPYGPQPPVNPPQPQPQPVPPQPMPQPPVPVADHKWVCVTEDYSTNDIYIGYGTVQFVARSKAIQACQLSASNCSSSPACEEQKENNPNAWYCESKNYSDAKVHSGTGSSITEAGFNARKECIKNSGTSSSSCARVTASNCAHQ